MSQTEIETGPEDPAIREQRAAFRISIYQSHVDHIRTGQARRYEILRFTIAGAGLYFAFLLSSVDIPLLCEHTGLVLFVLPGFVLALVYAYIALVNRNIKKHGAFIKFLFEEGLVPDGMGQNLYRKFLQTYEASWTERQLERGLMHYSQGFIVIMILACLGLYLLVDPSIFQSCQPKGS